MKKINIFFLLGCLCTLIWGTTFIAQDTGMDNIGPLHLIRLDFLLVFLPLCLLFLLLKKKKLKR